MELERDTESFECNPLPSARILIKAFQQMTICDLPNTTNEGELSLSNCPIVHCHYEKLFLNIQLEPAFLKIQSIYASHIRMRENTS